MINYTIYTSRFTSDWVTFVHGAGGSSSIWFKQLREFRKHINVLLVDLRGHGESIGKKSSYTFESVTNDLVEVLDYLKIKQSHFIGISLGTIVIRQLAETNPKRISSMVMGGAIIKMNFKSQILMKFGNTFKYIVPYIFLYKLFAYIIMPTKRNKESRLLFVREAKKLYQKEFIKWIKITSEINPVLKWFRQVEINIPTLYVMGEQDYMFLPSIKQIVTKHRKSASLKIIKQCGHVVNVEKPKLFNDIALNFINSVKVISTL